MAEKGHTELLPCPFCGGRLFRREYLVIEGVIGCRTCGATITRKHQPECDDGLLRAGEAWNMRAAVNTYPAVDGLVKALEAVSAFGDLNLNGEWEHGLRDIIRSQVDTAKDALSRFRSLQEGGES